MSKLNPLHTPEMIAQVISATGEYFDSSRRSGRSTALALRYIADVIEQPYTPVLIKDHYDSVLADRALAEIIRLMIFKLELNHMYIWEKAPANARAEFYVSFGKVSLK